MRRHASACSCCANNASEKMEQTGKWVREVARATEEQLIEDEQKAKDAKRMRWFVHEND